MLANKTQIDFFVDALGFSADVREDLYIAYDRLTASAHADWVAEVVDAYIEARDLPMTLRDALNRLTVASADIHVSPYILHLMFYSLLAEALLARYTAAGISADIWKSSMEDFACKLEECRKMHGVNGTFVGSWFTRFFDMTLFGLGRLEFEMAYTTSPYTMDGITYPQETPMLKVHIPSRGKLTATDCLDAFARAAEFFAHYFPQYKTNGGFLLSCHSWLLDPRLADILPPTSGILQFASLFTVMDTSVSAVNDCMWRIFYRDKDKDPADLPRDTSLQRAYADFLAAGNLPGSAMGLRFLPCK